MLDGNKYFETIRTLIKQTFIKSINKVNQSDNKTIYITDLVGCIRRSYYIKKYGFPVDESTALWLLLGTMFHDLIIPVIAEALNGQKEVPTMYSYEGVDIRGRVDILLDDAVIELKTCTKLPMKPKLSHVEQVNAYMHFFNKPKGVLVYVSKIQADVAVFECNKNPHMFQQTLEKAKILKEAIENNTPPEVNLPLSVRRQFCASCQFFDKCSLDYISNMIDLDLI